MKWIIFWGNQGKKREGKRGEKGDREGVEEEEEEEEELVSLLSFFLSLFLFLAACVLPRVVGVPARGWGRGGI